MLEKLEDLEFADDHVLLSQKITHVRQKFEALQEQADRVGLKVNPSKTKEMRIRASANAGDIMCTGKALEQITLHILAVLSPRPGVKRKMLRRDAENRQLPFPC